MTSFRHAFAAGSDWRTVTAEVGAQLTAFESDQPISQGAGLGFVYATEPIAENFSDIVTTLKGRTGVTHWVGCVGLGVCGGVEGAPQEVHDEAAVSALVAPWETDQFQVFDSLTTPEAVGPALAENWARANSPVFGVVHGDPRNRHIASIVEALPQSGGGYFVGGLTALADTPVQFADLPASPCHVGGKVDHCRS